MEWRHSGSSRPEKFQCKNPLEKFSPRFFGIKTASSSLIIFQRAKLSTRSTTNLGWCNCRAFWRKNAAEKTPKGFLQPRRNWPTWASSVLITHPILQIWPHRTTTCSLGLKNNWKGRHFSSDAEIIAAAETWLDGPYDFFFWVACKS